MAKLLFITQKVDVDDDLLGFVHRWLVEFAKNFETITVICLWRGDHKLPGNIRVLSLGKESGRSRVVRLLKFYQYIWRERNNYDGVFVHMNPIYAVLGGLFWRLLRKKILLWYTHPKVNIKLKLAYIMTNKIVTATKDSFPIKGSKKVIAVGHGIDTDFFRRIDNIARRPQSILFLARISPVKRPELLLNALQILRKKSISFHCAIIGDPLPNGEDYYAGLQNKAAEYALDNQVTFIPAIPNLQTPAIYNQNEVFVNLTPAGSFDKTILEAMACESLVLVSNPLFLGLIDENCVCRENDSSDLAAKLELALNFNQDDKKSIGEKLRSYVVKNHNLAVLARKTSDYYYTIPN